MDKKVFLAVALCLLILVSWSAFVSRAYHVDNKEVKENAPIASTPVITKQPPLLSVPEEKENARPFSYRNKNLEVIFNEPEAAIKEIIFKTYQSYGFDLKHGFLFGNSETIYKKEMESADGVTFKYADREKEIRKKFTFSNSNYDIWLEISIKNLTNSPLNIGFPLFLGELDFSSDRDQAQFKDITIVSTDKTIHPNSHKDATFEKIKFLGLRDRYFCAIIEPDNQNLFSGFVKKVNAQVSETGLQNVQTEIPANAEVINKFHIYLGPQDLQTITAVKSDWTFIINYGTFDFIAQILLQVLNFLFGLAHNWGWAIIILSVLIYFLFYPLTLKQMRSMKEMQLLQPHIEELRKKYKDNPQKLNKETMELYREHKVNPFGGCLPLLLQMPIFFALYQTLMRSISLRGADFLWIKDLSQPDRLFTFPVSLPFLGNEFNILPLIMTVGMFVQQKMSMATTATSSSAEQQKIMMIVMPLMFGLIFYHMPAGLVLYWFINSMLMLAYQIRTNKAKAVK